MHLTCIWHASDMHLTCRPLKDGEVSGQCFLSDSCTSAKTQDDLNFTTFFKEVPENESKAMILYKMHLTHI